MTEPNRRTRHLEQNRAQAAEAFACHVVTKQSEGRWLLQRMHKDGRPEWTFAAEIIALAGGALYVGGDIDHVVFAYGPPDPMARVRWMGESRDLGYYVPQKARLGSRDKSCVYDWDESIAHEELAEYLAEQRAEDGALFEDDAEFDEDEYSYAMRADERHSFVEHALEAFGGGDAIESIGPMGEVLSPAVIYAHAALARLCAIWREAEKAIETQEVAHA